MLRSLLLRHSTALGAAAATGVAIGACVVATQPKILAEAHAPATTPQPADSIFVINGFYMAMREKYTKPGAAIHYYLVEWDPKKLSWEDFRGKILGATDPTTANPSSLRKAIFDDWKALGLKSEPNVGDNGVHASASPFEALAERLNWLGASLDTDAFGKALLASGIPKDTVVAWTKDPQVPYEGKKQSLFDLLEDLDYEDCLKRAQDIAGASGKRPEGKMQAFVFIKPHAVTPKTQELVKATFAKEGITVYKEGDLDAKAIEQDKLIDNHYYAIANKASLSKPAELNPPAPKQEDFAKKFGITWADALKAGKVYNAVDGCKKLGIDGTTMDKKWAAAKKAGDLVKFGGGFYAGRIPVEKSESSAGFLSNLVVTVYALFGKE